MRTHPLFIAAALLVLLSLSGCAETETYGPAPQEPPDQSAQVPPAEGRWHRVSGFQDTPPDQAQEEELARLEAIGYVTGSRAAGGTGVTIHDPGLAGRGYNLYTSGHGPEALLIDMNGRELHRWRYPYHKIWGADQESASAKKKGRGPGPGPDVAYWRNARLLPNGDLLAIFEGRGLIKLDKDSNLLWASRCGAHHDLDLLDNGDILVLTREARTNPLVSEDQLILEDFIATIGAGGEMKHRISLLECFARAPRYEDIWRASENETGDIFHTNTLFLLRDPPAGALPAFTAGRVLTSMKCLNALAVVDLEQEKVVWARTGRFKAQHDPRLLANGNLLLFDNLGVPGRSRVLEFDLETWRPVWSYRGTAEHPFFSETCGTCQRLDNGNTLVTESDGGRAFEVTPGGEIVWQFWNPHRAGDRGQFIASLFTVRRLDSDFPVHWASGGPP